MKGCMYDDFGLDLVNAIKITIKGRFYVEGW